MTFAPILQNLYFCTFLYTKTFTLSYKVQGWIKVKKKILMWRNWGVTC